MARGQAQKADSQLNTNNNYAATSAAAGQQLQGPLQTAEIGQINAPGYTPQQEAAIDNNSFGAINNSFDAANASAGAHRAATNNPAGYAEAADKMARERGATLGSQAAANQVQFANNKQDQRNKGIQEANATFGIDEETLAKILGNAPGILGARAAGQSGDQIGQGWVNSIGSFGRG